jgi:uncharacterized protein
MMNRSLSSGFHWMRPGQEIKKLEVFRRLERFARTIEERFEPRADFDAVAAHERSISRDLGGRSVFDDVKSRRVKPKSKQVSLFDR